MTESTPLSTTASRTPPLDWLLVLSLSALPLVQPLFSVTGWAETLGRPQTPLVLAAVVTATWVSVVGFSNARRPVLTLLLAGAIAAVAATALSLLVPAMRTGDIRNVLDPFGIAAQLVVTVAVFGIWGAVSGLLAAGVRRLRGGHADPA